MSLQDDQHRRPYNRLIISACRSTVLRYVSRLFEVSGSTLAHPRFRPPPHGTDALRYLVHKTFSNVFHPRDPRIIRPFIPTVYYIVRSIASDRCKANKSYNLPPIAESSSPVNTIVRFRAPTMKINFVATILFFYFLIFLHPPVIFFDIRSKRREAYDFYDVEYLYAFMLYLNA